jgi:hypothetical protein
MAKSSLKQAKDELWELTRQIIFNRYPQKIGGSGKNKDKRRCYTCREGVGYSCGHLVPASLITSYVRYDLDNLRPQCFPCQKFKQGNLVGFVRNMRDEGIDGIDLIADVIHRADEAEVLPSPKLEWYLSKIDEYKKIYENETRRQS